jgi:hypothetical protein
MSACSLFNVNDSFCHGNIKEGKCPGLLEKKCVNEEAFARLALKHIADRTYARREIDREQDLARVTLGCTHFVRNDDPGHPPLKDIAETRIHIVRFMKREFSRKRRKLA